MKGREGDFPPGVGVHVTRVHSRDEFDDMAAWVDFCERQGVEPGAWVDVCEGIGQPHLSIDGKWQRWPNAIATCTCRWSRPAVSRVMARSGAFVHHQLNKLA